jgi:peptidoglycan L-alanyl-D-glutamate endopeptidase CwlK
MNKYGKRSLECLATCHEDLIKIMMLAIRRSVVDFGIHQSDRPIVLQQEYFNKGKSKINPKSYPSPEALCEKAKHVTIEGHPKFGVSRAVDIHISEKHKNKSLTWNEEHLAYVAGIINSCARELYDKGEIKHLVRWGADWDSDGVIALDHKLRDYPHHELLRP